MSRVLITGGSGFIGTNMLESCLSFGDEVLNLDIVSPRNPGHARLWREVDLRDRSRLVSAVHDFSPEVVFHLGARTDLFGSRIEDYSANTIGVSNLIEALKRLPSLRLSVFASSMLVCRIGYQPQHELDYCPSTAYGESKKVGEEIVRSEAAGHFPWTIVRPTSIWGPWFAAPYRDFFDVVRRGIYAHPKGQRVHRNYGFVLNSVAQLAALAEEAGGPLIGKTCYLADYEPIELKAWADMVQKAFDVKRVPELPLWLFKAAAIGGDILKKFGYRLPPMNSYRLNNMLTEMIHDTTPMQSVLPKLPYSIEDGVRITCDWLRAHSH